MFAVIFEVQPRTERWDEYLGIARSLKPKLEAIDGFIDNERFASRRTKGRLLSLSIWRDEKAVIRWRTLGAHHAAQERGRSAIFQDYHLRVGEVLADTQVPPGARLEQQRFDATEIGAAKVVTVTELSPPAIADPAIELGLPRSPADGLVDHDVFESITEAGKLVLLGSWTDQAHAERWHPKPIADMRHRLVRVIRDYGMHDRREAPQYYPAVEAC